MNSVSGLDHRIVGDHDVSASGSESLAAPSYIPGFDGLRAIAVLLVLVAHAGYGDLVPGGFGVTIFFAISGFLITTLLISENARTGRLDLPGFYTRRFLRLYPELIMLIALCLASAYLLPFQATVWEKLAGLLYYMNYYYVFGIHYPPANSFQWRQLWSLSVEEHFYFFFPVSMLILRTRRARLQLVAGLIVIPSLWRVVTYLGLGFPWQYNYVATDTRIDSIAWGCLLALLMHDGGGMRLDSKQLGFIRPWLVPVALAILMATLLFRSEDFRWTWRFTLQGLAIVLLIANILFDRRWSFVVSLLELTPIRFFGRISYGLYLYHMLLNRYLEEFAPPLPLPAFTAVSIGATFLVAFVSYQLLEVPLKSVRRRLGSHVR